MKRFGIVVLLVAILLAATACSKLVTEFARDAWGDEAAQAVEEQLAQNREEIKNLWNDLLDDHQSKESGDSGRDVTKKDEPERPDSAEETAKWESLVGTTIVNADKSDCYNSAGKNGYPRGQCTWYAYGRFIQEHGIAIEMSGSSNAWEWLDSCVDSRVEVVRDSKRIVPGCIAVDKGHVRYVEYVTYDENGVPLDVYYTECNWKKKFLDENKTTINPNWGNYQYGIDGIIKKSSFDTFENKNGSHEILGYIIAK